MIVLDGTATHTHRTNQDSVFVHDRNPTGKRNQAIVGVFNAIEGTAGLRELADLSGGHPEKAGGLCFLDSDIDAAEPGVIHACERFQDSAGIKHGDAHLGASCFRFLDRCSECYSCLFECEMHEQGSLLAEEVEDLEMSRFDLAAASAELFQRVIRRV
nr:hypothetical protein [Symmachiella macrocystis]